MINYALIEKEIVEDLKPNLFSKYLLISDLILKEINLNIIRLILEGSEELIILQKDMGFIRFSEIYFLKLMTTLGNDYIDFIKYGLNPDTDHDHDHDINLLTLKILNELTGQPNNQLSESDQIIVDEYNNLKTMIYSKFEDMMKYPLKSPRLFQSIQKSIVELKTDKKYLSSITYENYNDFLIKNKFKL